MASNPREAFGMMFGLIGTRMSVASSLGVVAAVVLLQLLVVVQLLLDRDALAPGP